MLTTKQCTKCLAVKDLDLFAKQARAKNGRQSQCKECNRLAREPSRQANREYAAQWRSVPENAESKRQWRKKYYLENKVAILKAGSDWGKANVLRKRELGRRYSTKPKSKAKIRAWRIANQGALNAYNRNAYASNPVAKAKQLAATKAWFAADPSRQRRKDAKRRARMASASGVCSKQEFQARWEVYGGMCAYCGKLAATIDHVIPLSSGGSNWPANLRPACKPCNYSKGDIPLGTWLARQKSVQ